MASNKEGRMCSVSQSQKSIDTILNRLAQVILVRLEVSRPPGQWLLVLYGGWTLSSGTARGRASESRGASAPSLAGSEWLSQTQTMHCNLPSSLEAL